MSILEKFLTKTMKIITTTLLFIVVIGNISMSYVYADVADVVRIFKGGAEFVNTLLETDGTSVVDNWMVNLTGIVIGGALKILGPLGTFSPEDQEKLVQVHGEEAVNELGYGFLDTTNDSVEFALSNYPGDVTPATYIATEWSPSRINRAEASTSGQVMLQPIKGIWNYAKQIAYTGFVVIVIVIGFMIMFRQKINGQVAVSITNSIPRVIVGMILVHASFFLAGLLLSISTFLMAWIGTLILRYYDENGIPRGLVGLGGPAYFWASTAFTLTGGVDVSGGFLSMVDPDGVSWFSNLLDLPSAVVSTKQFATSPTWNGFGMILASAASDVVGMAFEWKTILVRLIMGFGLIYAGFKIFFNLIMAYAQIFLKVVVLPIVVLIGTIPGQEAIIINSFKGIFADSLMFPVTFAMINLGVLFAVSSMERWGGSPITFPEGLQTTIVDPGAGNMGGLIGYAVVLATASADKFIKEFLKIQPSQAAQAAAQNVAKFSSKTPLLGGLVKGMGD